MTRNDLIILDPAIAAGKPVLRGTRLTVEFIVGLLGQGWTDEQIFAQYPGLTRDHILACLNYAGEVLREERVFALPSASD